MAGQNANVWPVCPSRRQAEDRGILHATPHPAELPLPGEDYNVAPTTFQPIIRQSRELGERELVLAQWGLVPFFTKELSGIKGLSTINARAESTTKASYLARTDEETPPHRARLVVLRMEKAGKPPKTPYSFKLANGHPIGFADLWDAWKDKQGHWLQSFAIVTTEANELMSRVHPRNAVHPLPISLKLRPACGLPGDYVIGINTQTLMYA